VTNLPESTSEAYRLSEVILWFHTLIYTKSSHLLLPCYLIVATTLRKKGGEIRSVRGNQDGGLQCQ
jgi:hypothetical protein